LTNKELVDHAQKIGLPVKSHSSSIDAEQAKQLLSSFKATGTDSSKKTAKATPKVTEEPKSQNRVIVAGGKKWYLKQKQATVRLLLVAKSLSDEEVSSGRVISVGGKTVAPIQTSKAETKQLHLQNRTT
jgi:translation initiation factor IF-2